MYPVPPREDSEECILPELCFIGTFTWDIDKEMEGVPEVRIPTQCSVGEKFVPSLAMGHPSTHETHQLLQGK